MYHLMIQAFLLQQLLMAALFKHSATADDEYDYFI